MVRKSWGSWGVDRISGQVVRGKGVQRVQTCRAKRSIQLIQWPKVHDLKTGLETSIGARWARSLWTGGVNARRRGRSFIRVPFTAWGTWKSDFDFYLVSFSPPIWWACDKSSTEPLFRLCYLALKFITYLLLSSVSFLKFWFCRKVLEKLCFLPRHGSFLDRNSSSADQPPPTRTITVDLRMRTSRSCWESPN